METIPALLTGIATLLTVLLNFWKSQKNSNNILKAIEEKNKEQDKKIHNIESGFNIIKKQIEIQGSNIEVIKKYYESERLKTEIAKILKKRGNDIIKSNRLSNSELISFLNAGVNAAIYFFKTVLTIGIENINEEDLQTELTTQLKRLRDNVSVEKLGVMEDFLETIKYQVAKPVILILVSDLIDLRDGMYNGKTSEKLKKIAIKALDTIMMDTLKYYRGYKRI